MQHTMLTLNTWNGTAFVYNAERDTWQMMDNVTIGPDHHADGSDLFAARECAMREKILFNDSIHIDTIDDEALR